MRHRSVNRLLPLAFALAVGCAGSSGSCTDGPVESIPSGGFQGVLVGKSAQVKISKDGLAYLNSHWQELLVNLLPGASLDAQRNLVMSVPLECMSMPQPVTGLGETLFICDNGKGVDKPGFMDAKCDLTPTSPTYDIPCPMRITVKSLVLTPEGPDKVGAEVTLQLDATRDDAGKDGSIFIDSLKGAGICGTFRRTGIYVNFHSGGRGSRDEELVGVKVRFGLDAAWNDQMTFDLVPPNPNEPEQLIAGIDELEKEDLQFDGFDKADENMCEWVFDILKIDMIKGLILNFIKPQVQTMIRQAVDVQRCRPCNPADPTVPVCPSGSMGCQCPSGGTCKPTEKICMGNGGRCVPRLLGFEGRIKTGEMLADFGGDPASKFDLFAAAGGSAPVITDSIELPVVAGGKGIPPVKGPDGRLYAPCVPTLPAPQQLALPAPTLDADAPVDQSYHVALALSQQFLNSNAYQLHQAGSLCLNLSGERMPTLSSGLFKIALPSLGVLTGSDTRDAPMMIALRPLSAPVLHVGEGSYDPTTKKPIKPLLTVELTDVRIDIYALVEERFVRLFTLAADVKLPLSVVVEGCPMTVLPALGDLKQMVVIRKDVSTNAEILAEDPSGLAQLIPMILGMAEPVIGTMLAPIEVPDMGGFRVLVNENGLKGVGRVAAGSDDFHYLGLYGTLGPAGHCPLGGGERARARLVAWRLPTREQMQLRADQPLPWPVAILEVEADGEGEREFAWRVDGGLWSTWFAGPRLEVEHPALIMPGRHRIEVRARRAGEPMTVGPAAEPVAFVVDYEPPQVSFSSGADGQLHLEARDAISPAEALRYAYRLGEGALSEFGPAQELEPEAIARAGFVEVQVKDEAGLIGRASWRAPRTAGMSGPAGQGTGPESAGGCSAAGAGLGLLALALWPFALRRRSR